MAARKKEDEGAQDGGVQTGAETNGEREAAAMPEAAEMPGEAAEQIVRVYIGPSIPFGKLRTSMILRGTQEEIGAYVEDMLERYPEIPHLLIAPDKLPQALERVGRKGNILHKYYEDVLAKSRAARKG